MNKLIKKTMHLVIALVCCVSLFLAGIFIVPEPMTTLADPNGDVEVNPNFVSFNTVGLEDGTYENSSDGTFGEYNGDFGGKTFSGYVTFTRGSALYIAGMGVKTGLKVAVTGATANNRKLEVTWGSSSTSVANILERSANGISLLEEFLLQTTFQKDGSDLKVSIRLEQGEKEYSKDCTVTDAASELGTFVGITYPVDSPISIRNDNRAPAVPKKELYRTSINHFYLEDGVYGYTDGTVATSGATISGVENTYFGANVKFSGEGAQFLYAGNAKENALGGISFMLLGGNIVATFPTDTNLEDLTIVPADAGVTAFADTQFKLGISMEKVNADQDEVANDIELGIWINDVLYKQTRYTINNYAGKFGTAAGVFNPVDDGSTVEISVVSGLEITLPDKELQKITLDRFEIMDGIYAKENAKPVKGVYKYGLTDTYFAFNVKFNLDSTDRNQNHPALIFNSTAESDDDIGAFRIRVVGTGRADKIEIWNARDTGLIAAINAQDTNVSDFKNKFKLGISTEIVDRDGDGNVNDVKYGFYVNDDFCGNVVYESGNVNENGYWYVADSADTVGGRIAFLTPYATSLDISSVEVLKAPIASRPLDDEGFNKITFDAFEISDGVYKNKKGGNGSDLVSTKGIYNKTYDNLYFSGTVKFTQNGTKASELIYAATDNDGWEGIYFMPSVSGTSFLLKNRNDGKTAITFLAEKTTVKSFIDTEFNIGISTRFVDHDGDGEKNDVELGIWFNDILYNDEYIYYTDFADKLGKTLTVHAVENTTVTIKSREELKIPIASRPLDDEGFNKITFDAFEMRDGVYEYKDSGKGTPLVSAKGTYTKTYDNVYFSGTVKFTQNGTEVSKLIYAATDNDGWAGIYFMPSVSGTSFLLKNRNDGKTAITFLAEKTTVKSFIDTEFNIGISTRFVDHDGDGEKNDVELGIWFNDILYNDEYIYYTDFKDELGAALSLVPYANTTLAIKSREELKKPIASRPLDDEGFNKITFDAFEMRDGVYEYKDSGKGTPLVSAKGTYTKTYDNVYFSGTVKYTQNGTRASELIYAATGDEGTSGIYFIPSADGTSLQMRNTNADNDRKTFVAEKTTVKSFIDTEFNIGISTRFVDHDGDGEKDDVELGIWFNDILYNDEYIYYADFKDKLGATLSILPYANTTLAIKSREELKKPIASRPLDDEGFNKITFDAFEMRDGVYEYKDSGKGTPLVSAKGTYTKTYDNVYFSGTVKYTQNGTRASELIYAATGDEGTAGIYFIPSASGTSLQMRNTNADYDRKTFLAEKTTVKSFIDTEFNIGISTRFVDHDGDGEKDDVELGIWFNDILYNDEYIYYTDFKDKLGATLSILPYANTTLAIKSREELKKPIASRPLDDEGFNKITFDAFEISDGVYKNRNNGKGSDFISAKGTYTKTYDNLYFSGTVKFTANKDGGVSELIYASTDKDGWSGIYFIPSASGTSLVMRNTNANNDRKTFLAEKTTVKSFIDTEFNIGISTKFVDCDGDGKKDDVELGIWFNDILYNDEYIYYTDFADGLGSALALHAVVDTTVTIKSRKDFKAPVESRPLDKEGFNKITFDAFEMSDGVYKNRNNGKGSDFISAKGTYTKTYDNLYFSGTVKFTANKDGGVSELIYASTDKDGWSGIYFIPSASGTSLVMRNTNANNDRKTFLASKTTVQNFIDTEFNIGISTKFVDCDGDGKKDDVELGVWFNDILYNDEYIYYTDFADGLGSALALHAVVDTTVTIKSRDDLKAPITSRPLEGEGFTTITFENFSISNGVYANRNNGKGSDFISKAGYFRKSYNNIYFSGTVKFTQNGTRASELIYAATDKDGWAGIYFMPSASGTALTMRNTNDNNSTKTFLASKTTAQNFIDTEFNLGISTKFVDLDGDGQKNDVELGIWFNDILYNDEYIYYTDFADKLGSILSLHAFENTTVTVKSRDQFFTRFSSENRPEDFEKISTNYFAINDGTYKFNSKRLTINAPYGASLDNTYCEFYVNPSVSEKEISIRYAGSGWTGLLIRFSKDSLYIYEASGRSQRYTFTPKQAGVNAFAGEEFKLAISTQYLDLDNDGKKNDVRFGVWVNGGLCDNEYIDLLDYVQYMGSNFGVFIEDDNATLGFRAVNIPINFEMFGFTKDWERELGIFGKTTTLGNSSSSGSDPISPETGNTPIQPMIFSCVALGGLIDTEKKQRRKLIAY